MSLTHKQRELADIFDVPLDLVEAIQQVTKGDVKDKKKSDDKKDNDKGADKKDDTSDDEDNGKKKTPFGDNDDKSQDGDFDGFGNRAGAGDEDGEEDGEWKPEEGDPNGLGTGEMDAKEEEMREKAEDEVAADLAKRYNTSMDKITMYPSTDGVQFTK